MPQPLMILLGAGSSFGYAPQVADITNRLLEWDYIREPDPKIWPDPFQPHRGKDLRKPFFKVLHDILCRGYYNTGEPLNFECLIHIVELLATHLPLRKRRNKKDPSRSLLAPLIQIRRSRKLWDVEGVFYNMIAELASRFVLDIVDDFIANKSADLFALVKGIKKLSSDWACHVISLNYDDLICQADIDFYTGFEDLEDEQQVFAPEYPWPKDKHSLCQLHGSVLFGRSIKQPFELVRYKDRCAARASRRGSGSSSVAQDGHTMPAVEMITGLRKTDKLLSRPYGTYYHVFRELALSSERWLIIGYGGADQHINDILAQTRNNWLSRKVWNGHSVDHRVVWVDKIDLHGQKKPSIEELMLFMDQPLPVVDVFCDGMKRTDYLNTRVMVKTFTCLGPGLTFSGDGVEWALGDGFDQIKEFLTA